MFDYEIKESIQQILTLRTIQIKIFDSIKDEILKSIQRRLSAIMLKNSIESVVIDYWVDTSLWRCYGYGGKVRTIEDVIEEGKDWDDFVKTVLEAIPIDRYIWNDLFKNKNIVVKIDNVFTTPRTYQ